MYDRSGKGGRDYGQVGGGRAAVGTPGKRTLTEGLQLKRSAAAVQEAAAEGVSGTGGRLPHADRIAASFGAEHDLSGVTAHVGGAAADACASIGASAYANGSHVAFREAPDLHTAAHEAAHVVQQRAGVQLYGGVGESGDSYERQADAVADRVVAGQSAADLFDGALDAGWAGGSAAAVQKRERETAGAEAAPPDTTWAEERRTQVRALRARVTTMHGELLAEALATSDTLKAARAVFAAFEDRHADAVASFEK